jgi:hypothetical protein
VLTIIGRHLRRQEDREGRPEGSAQGSVVRLVAARLRVTAWRNTRSAEWNA